MQNAIDDSLTDTPFAIQVCRSLRLQMITPALTTIEQPALEMGKMACQILVSQIDRSRQEQPPDQKAQAVAITLEPRLVSRQSTTRRTL